ncbi:FtsJ-like methyltransferase [Fragilaria crotonensis]|nr:FtsJ-like methyltransferase [Fragilaria crotonensis]
MLRQPLVEASSPFPGLVRIENLQLNGFYEPIYALQALPECRIIEVPESIKGLARAITEIAHFKELLASARQGSLSIHALVPGMCKGQKDPILQRRSTLIAETTHEIFKNQYPAAARKGDSSMDEQWLLQILLLSPDVLAVSLGRCQRIPSFPNCVWPNPSYPLGLANVDISMKMPSSAYRKLLEAFACWGAKPAPGETVVDLGASPGGWTAAALQVCQCRVIAVDRSELHDRMKNNLLVKFVKGDAFAYKPEMGQVDWMRRPGTPLKAAIQVARTHGYCARAKHFFNNKNEVTLMVEGKEQHTSTGAGIEAMYPIVWPKS